MGLTPGYSGSIRTLRSGPNSQQASAESSATDDHVIAAADPSDPRADKLPLEYTPDASSVQRGTQPPSQVVTSRKTHKQTGVHREARCPNSRLGKEQHAPNPQPRSGSTVIVDLIPLCRSREVACLALRSYWTRWRAREHSPVSLGLRRVSSARSLINESP